MDLEAIYRELLVELDRRELPYIRSEVLDFVTNFGELYADEDLETLADRWELAYLMPDPDET